MPGFQVKVSGHTKEAIEKMQAAVRQQPGLYSFTITKRPSEIDREINKFYRNMKKAYPTFRLVATNSTMCPIGMCFTITYEI